MYLPQKARLAFFMVRREMLAVTFAHHVEVQKLGKMHDFEHVECMSQLADL